MATSLEDFKLKVRSMVKIDDDISAAGAMLKELRAKKSEIQREVMQYMNENNINTCNVEGGKLTLGTSKSMSTVKRDDIVRAFADTFGCETGRAAQVIEGLYENRQVTERTVLRRTRKRTKQSAEMAEEEEEEREEDEE